MQERAIGAGRGASHTPRLTHPLSGANLATLLRAVARGGGVRAARWPQAAIALGACLGRLPFTLTERAYVATALGGEPPAPVFILGHWRSGTTHLYNILSRGEFAYVTPLAAGMPWDLLGLVRVLRPLLERTLPNGRFIDNIPVTPDSPQEDEVALANMTTVSYYHALYFPKHFSAAFNRGLFFDGCTPAEVEHWMRRLRHLFAKVTHAHGGRRLLVKNPGHTARVALLHRMFPGAKFIHIHRNPHELFESTKNFYEKLFPELALQDFAQVDIEDHILVTFARMMDRLLADAARLPEGSFVELSYDELVADPLGALARIYDRLALEGFEAARPRFEAYLGSVRGYRPNRYSHPEESAALVEAHWARFLEHWDYRRPGSPLPHSGSRAASAS